MKKVLIFYASYGGGHLSAANAIKQCIEENYKEYETKLVDCMQFVNKPINKITTTAYKEMAKKFPWVWGDFYYHSENGPLDRIVFESNKILSKKLLILLKEYNPDIVISTHAFANQMISYLKRKGLISCKSAVIITDFELHNQWIVGNQNTDYIFVSNLKLKEKIIELGVSENKIFITGIPISNRFSLKYNKVDIKKEFNLDSEKKVILLFGGGEFGLGREQTIEVLKAFIDNIGNMQIVAISGKNEKMKEEFNNIVKEKKAEKLVKVLDYTNQVPELMSISDLVVTKPGGLTTSESLASELPIVVINPIPGQEEENAEFLVNSGVAIWLKKDENISEKIHNLLSDESKLNEMKKNAKILAKKDATKNICKIIME